MTKHYKYIAEIKIRLIIFIVALATLLIMTYKKIIKIITASFTIDFKHFYTLLPTTIVIFIIFFFGLFFVGNPYG